MKSLKLTLLQALCILLVFRASATVRYVDLNSSSPAPPYTSWNTASINIQSAIDAASSGDVILVTNGVYASGGRVVFGTLTNRVVVNKPLTLSSVNGPAVTTIEGFSPLGETAVRCVELADGATLSGFTLHNGATLAWEDNYWGLWFGNTTAQSGGGVYCDGTNALVTNCIITACSAMFNGGGAAGGRLINCTLTNNTAVGPANFYVGAYFTVQGGGAYNCTLINCAMLNNQSYGSAGGAEGGVLTNCILSGNFSQGDAGGAENSVLLGCTISNNSALGYNGGGVLGGSASHCTIAGNSAEYFGGGVNSASLSDCIITNNSLFGVPGYRDYSFYVVQGGGAYSCNLKNSMLLNNYSPGSAGGAEGGALTNCVVSGNVSGGNAGGTEYSALVNCAVSRNVALGNTDLGNGGGMAGGTASHCTIVGNTAHTSGGGGSGVVLSDCIVYDNSAPQGANSGGSTLNFCCTTPLPDSGTNNLTAAPQLTDLIHLAATSPCLGAGQPGAAVGTDIDGETWLNPPAIGCDQYHAGAASGPLSVSLQSDHSLTANTFPVFFLAGINGRASMNTWNFGDGTTATNQLSATHAWALPGNYSVVFTAFNNTFPGGISATTTVSIVSQVVHYVSASSTNPVAPYLSWSTAATSLQTAVDAVYAAPKALVLVSNGVYIPVTIGKPIAVQSVNGPAFTVIDAGHAASCVDLTTNVFLAGFTLTNGFAGDSGGGVLCETGGSIVSNCVVVGNFAQNFGGGIDGGTIYDSVISGNSADSGGGAYGAELIRCRVLFNLAGDDGGGVENCLVKNSTLTANNSHVAGGAADASTLYNCTISGNHAGNSGGGANNSTLDNCIAYFNTANNSANYSASTLNFSCTTPLPGIGTNNTAANPQLADNAHISASSPCIGAGSTSFTTGTDIDSEVWKNPPSIGCDEFYAGAVTTTLSVTASANFTNLSVGFPASFSALISGRATGSTWDFGDGVRVTNQIYTAHSWSSPGNFLVTFTAFNDANPGGVSAVISVQVTTQAIFYVATTNVNPVAPFNSWATAATNIQDAVDAAPAGSTVLVNDGIYQSGGRVVYGVLTNRVAVTRPMNLQSVNGAIKTIISGNYEIDDNAVRGLLLFNGCTITGFTVTNGATRGAGNVNLEQSGGGLWCESTNVSVTNCLFTTCAVPQFGGGGCGGTFNNCTFANDSASSGGGGAFAALSACTMTANNGGSTGGGAYECTLNNSTVTANSAASSGGGVSECIANNCLIATNSIGWGDGGGASSSTLSNCDLIQNNSPIAAGGAEGCTLVNCRLLNNTAGDEGGGGGGADNCTLEGCLLAGNTIYSLGGGASSSTLNNCTLTNNWCSSDGGGAYDCILTNCILSENSAGGNGGGACVSTVNNCRLFANTAGYSGGGYSAISFAYFGRGNSLSNCVVFGNSASQNGGGVEGGIAVNCSITGNFASQIGGGSHNSALGNCIDYFNTAGSGANFSGGTLNYCCTLPLPASGFGNLTNDPQMADLAHIGASSPCRGAGSVAYTRGTDIDGDAWLNPPSIGCDEFNSTSATGSLAVSVSADYTNCAANFTLNFFGSIAGHASACIWDFGDGTTLTNELFNIQHSWAAAGTYYVTLTAFNNDNPAGVSATVVIQVAVNPIHYVSTAGVNPVSPFTSWATAATNIQDAVDAAFVGGTVLVTDGIYSNGGYIVYGDVTNRVAVTKPLTVQSVNGPGVTVIQGQPENNHIAVRCAYLANGAVLNGFTLTNGGTLPVWYEPPDADLRGGGVWGETNAVITHCVLVNNSAGQYGGGAYGGILNQCTLVGNFSWYGGGASSSVLNNCLLSNNVASYAGWANGGGAYGTTLNNCVLANNFADSAGAAEMCLLNNCAITGNSAGGGIGGVDSSTLNNCTVTGNSAQNSNGGASASTLNNCIIYYNHSITTDPNFSSCTLNYCCTPTLQASGVGNITSDPQFADAFHISAGSPCRGAGSASYVGGVDIDGEAWANPPSIGCDEYHAGAISGPLSVAVQADYTNVATGFIAQFTAQINGHADSNAWNFDDGTIVSDRPYASHSYAAGGDYTVIFTAYNDDNPAGVSATLTMHVEAPLHYVAQANPNPVSPYNSWATAATNIQDAANVAFAGGTIIVSNGLYQFSGLVINGLTNRVALTQPMNLQSVNGPGVTIIQGTQVPTDPTGNSAVRCVFLADRTTISGFTLTNGSSGQGSGGAWCDTANVVVSNCVVTGNINGGINNALVNNCVIANNDSGAASCTLNNCLVTNNYGGGIVYCVANDSTISGNSSYNGGGAYWSTLNRCIVANNYAAHEGGGMCIGDANNCLFTGNSAGQYSGPGLNVNFNNCTIVNNADGPGVSWLNNCIVYSNTAWNSDSYSTFNNCCTIPLPSGGTGNFTNDPAFVDAASGNFHLRTNSPCINSGNNAAAPAGTDFGGNPRIKGGTVDVGAYEFQTPASILSYAWLQQYGLPIDGTADKIDSDGDGMNNWQEWIAGTSPINPASLLTMTTVSNSVAGTTVTWQSSLGVTYYLQRSVSLPAFTNIQCNLVGQAGTTSYTDTGAQNSTTVFYRVGVQQ